eukprot:3941159-Rhodomonas_salina.1
MKGRIEGRARKGGEVASRVERGRGGRLLRVDEGIGGRVDGQPRDWSVERGIGGNGDGREEGEVGGSIDGKEQVLSSESRIRGTHTHTRGTTSDLATPCPVAQVGLTVSRGKEGRGDEVEGRERDTPARQGRGSREGAEVGLRVIRGSRGGVSGSRGR